VLGGLIVGCGRPFQPLRAAFAGNRGAGLDQGATDAAPALAFGDVEVVQQHRLGRWGGGEGPVKAGVADKAPLPAGAEQQATLAGSDEAAEEGADPLLPEVLDLLEAQVGGDQRHQLLELLGGDGGDLQLGAHDSQP
jgi:hypothetical protein